MSLHLERASRSRTGLHGFANLAAVTPAISVPAGAVGHLVANKAAEKGMQWGTAAAIGAGAGGVAAAAATAVAYGLAKAIGNMTTAADEEQRRGNEGYAHREV